MRLLAIAVIGLLGGLLVGCAADKRAGAPPAATEATKRQAEARDRADAGRGPNLKQDGLRKPAAKEPKAEPVERKILYTGQVEVTVERFDPAQEKLRELVKEFRGYVANSEVTGTTGQSRWGSWTVRIPSGRFDDFVAAVAELGELRKATRDSQDVTDAYYDTRAELKNLEAGEEALRKLYDRKVVGDKVSELLEVRRELEKVRGEINVRKGQLQRWDKLSEYATLTVRLSARTPYDDPAPPFGTRIGRTWERSIETLVTVGKGMTLAAVALTPWLVLLGVVAVPTWLVARRLPRNPPPPPPPPPAVPNPEGRPE